MLSNISPVNFTPVDASVAGALEGIDAQLGLNSFSDIFTPTITNVLGTSGSFTLLYAAYTYGKSAAGNVCVVNVKYQYTPTAVDNFVSITIPIGNNFSGATQANMMGSNCYSVVPVGGDIYDISSINTQAAVQVTNKSDVAALNVVNTVNLSFSYLIQ
jgi:hypothetical protein